MCTSIRRIFNNFNAFLSNEIGLSDAIILFVQHREPSPVQSPAIGSVSGKLWHEMNQTILSPDMRAYFSWGTLEGYGGMQKTDPWQEDRQSWLYKSCRTTANKIIKQGGEAMLYCQIGGRHCEADWEKQLPLFMPFLWQS